MTEPYPKFGSIPRIHRDVVITEKVDGTNGLISIQPFPDTIGAGTEEDWQSPGEFNEVTWFRTVSGAYAVKAGSRNRWLTRTDDNFGFAKWVQENVRTLVTDLGEGMHYGEWYGSGIQRGYGLTKGHKRFALFNTSRWTPEVVNSFGTPDLLAVPVLATVEGGHYLYDETQDVLGHLEYDGSVIEPGFDNPEGVVLYHTASRQYFKATIEDDEVPKSQAKGAAAA